MSQYTPQEEKTIRKLKRINYTIFGVVAALAIAFVVWLCTQLYWSSFSSGKWAAHPDRRAGMVDDLLADYNLIGMSEADISQLLGPNDNDTGYFQQTNRYVYCLGNQRTTIDREWLLIDFTNGRVQDYSITTD